MSPAPNVVLALVAITSIIFSIVLVGFVLFWTRLSSRRHAAVTRRVDELSERYEAMEQTLAQLRMLIATGTDSSPTLYAEHRDGGISFPRPRTSVRVDSPAANLSTIPSPTLIAIPNLSAPDSQRADVVAEELASRFGGIWELADAGNTPDFIARSSGLPIGQVELILALRRQLATYPGDPS